MSHSRHSMSLLIGTAIAAGSMFSMQAMAHGYMQDASASQATASKAAEGKCGEGKCGAGMTKTAKTMATDAKASEGKCGEGKCGGHKAKAEGGCGMAMMDTDKDGRLSHAEFDAAHSKKFSSLDADGDGFISQAEMDQHHAAMKPKTDDKAGDKAMSEGKCGEGKCGGKM